jgi:cysteine synthase
MVKKQSGAPAGFTQVGKNVALKVEGSTLTLVVDLATDQGQSKSGKSVVIATTSGNLAIPGATNGAVLGLNIYRK